ncbi:hypothetical protein BDV28DRAFT_140998 [Aspergillus coremiiformis]|uniref:P-loop containing nucleoside triphosphate hydrolase protein n=1 Tax=Aspergillus coremiiformis TaxID=138285 RepID=A0A5N6YVU4_9EURO|nr:hypothetical protein BDV28DRAFT_140998 [Aspergillus coremiiformis]
MIKKTSDGGCEVLILDETTGSFDSETDRRIQEVLRDAFKDSTVTSVAHNVRPFSFCSSCGNTCRRYILIASLTRFSIAGS